MNMRLELSNLLNKNSEKMIINDIQLMAEWNEKKNNAIGLFPYELTLGSGKKVWWICQQGHEWQACIRNRSAHKTGCPYCSGRIAISGINDLSTMYPDIAKEWNYDKNEELLPTTISGGSGKKVWWKCSLGHEWISTVEKRTKLKTGCPYCANKIIIPGFNDLATKKPSLVEEWNNQKNGDLLPTMVSEGSSKKVWWICRKGHEWQAEIANRANGTNCPYCSGKEILVGYNDLSSIKPEIVEYWNFEKNGDFQPNMFSAGSGKKVWWKCSLGHEWQATIANRVKGKNCPYCSNTRVQKGFNDLATLYPDVVEEWNNQKNGDLLPTMVSPGTKRKVWWICRKGHEWEAAIYSRTYQHTGCPECRKEQQTSFPEQAILFYCKKETFAEGRNQDYGKEIDIYFPEYRIGIEYNGIYWHKSKKDADRGKVDFFAEKNIRIITIAEGKENAVNGDTIEYVYNASNRNSLNWAIRKLFELIGFAEIDIDVTKDTTMIYNQYISTEKDNSLATHYPMISTEWCYEKNKALKPEMILPNSNKKVWWICQQGHEWQAVVSSRVAKGNGCPYCAGQRVWIGYNDLGTTNPELINEWDFDKNYILPSQVRGTSSKVVWWKCSLGHSYDMRIYYRAGSSKAGCPYCAIPAKRVLSGFNDLATISPYTLNEWDYEKNDISPAEVLPGSTQKVWWKCSKNHSFQQAINYKTSSKKESTCPYCSNKKVKKGYNDLATLSPELALEWHPTKNGHLLPTDVTLGSHKNVWWKCINGHEWQTKIETRKQGCGCPICSKHR